MRDHVCKWCGEYFGTHVWMTKVEYRERFGRVLSVRTRSLYMPLCQDEYQDLLDKRDKGLMTWET